MKLDREALRRLGIDPEEGLAYCAEDPEFYEEMLREYLKESVERAEELARFFREENWQRYGVCAHTVKSTTRTVGARALAERAHAAELAGREGDAEAIRAGHAHFMKEFTELADGLRAVLDP